MPIFLFIGEEESLITQLLADFKFAFSQRYGSGSPEFNLEKLQGDKDSVQKIIESCCTLPFASEKKLVIVSESEKLSSDSQEKLKTYCQNPNPSTSLLLLWNGKPNQSTLSKELPVQIAQKGVGGVGGMVVKCWGLYEAQRVQWIQKEVDRFGKRISLEAANFLSREGGQSLKELGSEIEKTILLIGEEKTIDLAHVQESISFRRHQSVWNFTENLEKGHVKEAGKILERCLEEGEEPIKLLNLFARSLRRMSEGTDLSPNQKLTLQPDHRSAGVSGSKEKLFNELKRSDLLLKSGDGTESAIFERLLCLFQVGNF